VSLSEPALSQGIERKVLPGISTSLATSLNALVGQKVEALLDPCDDAAAGAITATVRFQGRDYTAGAFVKEMQRLAVRPPAQPLSVTRPPSRPHEVLNDPPSFDPIANQETNVNKLLALDLVASDPDGDAITFTGVGLPPNARVVGSKFEFHPDCDQVGDHAITIEASDGALTASQGFTVTVHPAEIPDTYNAEFQAVHFDPATMHVTAVLAATDRIELTFDSGPLAFDMSAGDCYGDCLLDCCVSWSLNFTINMTNVKVKTSLTPEQLLCGVSNAADIPDPAVDIEGLSIDFGDPHIGGVFGWLTGAALLTEVLNVFGVPQTLLDAFASDAVVDQIQDPLKDSIVNQFPGITFSGLKDMGFAVDLPDPLPVTLAAEFSDLPVITPHEAISIGIHSAFTAKTPVDPVPPWFPTLSAIPNVFGLGGDFTIGTSDDALNQLMSQLVAAGKLRSQFSGFTVGDIAPGLSLPAVGVGPGTPILLTIDAAQDAFGNGIPPIIGFIDDPATPDVFEAKVRVQLTVRGILENGGVVTDDRSLCSCTSLSPSCVGQPCLLYETVLKMNLLVNLSLDELVAGVLASLNIEVGEVQLLNRGSGFDSFEASDFTDDESEIAETSATSPVLALLRDKINDALPPLLIPPDALSLGGVVTPVNLRLFMAQVSHAGLGDQDYFGLLADVDATAPQRTTITPRAQVVTPVPVGTGGAVTGGTVPAGGASQQAAANILLAGNFPNPFGDRTSIRATMPRASSYTLTIYAVNGRVIRTFEGSSGPGNVEVAWDGTDASGHVVPNGVYFYRFVTPEFRASRKMMLAR
jgi:hypothetical protein